MHTEEEARTLWCPMVRVADESGSPENRACSGGLVEGTKIPWNNCIASGCMMWRWEEGFAPTTAKAGAARNMKPIGYCSLAGKP